MAIAALATLYLWGHSWAWMIFVAEACFVVWRCRNGTSFVVGDVIFWALVGVPLVFLFYHLSMGMDLTATWLVAVKQSVNGIAVAAVASLLNYVLASTTRFSVKAKLGNLLIDRTILIGLIPVVMFAFVDNQRRGGDVDIQLAQELEVSVFELQKKISSWSLNEIARISDIGVQALRENIADSNIAYTMLEERFARTGMSSLGVYEREGQVAFLFGNAEEVPTRLSSPAKRKLEHIASSRSASAILRRSVLDGLVQISVPIKKGPAIGGFAIASFATGELDFITSLSSQVHAVRLASIDNRVVAENQASKMFSTESYSRTLLSLDGVVFAKLMPRDGAGSVMNDFARSYLSVKREFESPLGMLILMVRAPYDDTVQGYRYEQAVTLTIAFVLLVLLTGLAVVFYQTIGRGLQNVAQTLNEMTLDEPLQIAAEAYPIQEVVDILQIAKATNQKIIGQARDIGELGSQLKNLVQSMPIIAYTLERVKGEKWRVVFSSSPGAKMSWFDSRMLSDRRSWLDGVHPDDQRIAEDAITGFRGTGIKSAEYRVRTKGGDWRWICDDLEIISRNPDTGLQVASGAITDVHERRTSAERLNSTSRLITLGEMATGMAHEINQPLNTIRMAAENALLEIAAPAKGDVEDAYIAEKLDRIVSQTDRAAGIIDHMRIFGRRTSDLPEPFRVPDAVEGALKIVEPRLRIFDIAVQTDPALQELPELIGHQQLLEQVLINLMLNAKDAIRTRIEASAENEVTAAGKIDIRFEFQKLAGAVVIEVRDNGGGVPGQVASRLFDPFFTTKPVGQGTGLGLSVSYGIVSEMGGLITFHNCDDGAVFQISLPVANMAPDSGGQVDSGQSS